MNILIILFMIVCAIDEFGLTQVLHRPLVACTVLGILLQDVQKGLAIGLYLESMYILMKETSFLHYRVSLLFASLISMLTLTSNYASDAISVVLLFGVICSVIFTTAIDFVSTIFIPLARSQAAKAKGVGGYHIMAILLRCIVVAAVTFIFVQNQANLTQMMQSLLDSNLKIVPFILIGIGAVIPCLGIVVLLRNLSAQKNTGPLFIGMVIALLFFITTKNAMLSILFVALLALGLGFYEYSLQQEPKQTNKESGGSGKWW